jgi:hypothetical protein
MSYILLMSAGRHVAPLVPSQTISALTPTVARADNYFAEYRMLFSRRRGNEGDIFEIALDGTSLFRGSCIDVIKSRKRKNLKAPASSRIMPFFMYIRGSI